jgi:hypothetical protein
LAPVDLSSNHKYQERRHLTHSHLTSPIYIKDGN